MFIRLGMSMAIIAGIFVFSPMRQGDDPAGFVANAKEAVMGAARQRAGGAALLAGAVASAPASDLRPTLEGLVVRALAESAAPKSASSAVAPLDTLTPTDRRAAWKGIIDG